LKALFLACTLLSGFAFAFTTYDATADFGIAANPSPGGSWSYGWEQKLGSELHLYTRHYDTGYWGARVIGWSISGEGPQNGDFCCPFVARNISSGPIDTNGALIPLGQLWFHPGPRGEYSIVRWTCPAPGRYHVAVRFDGFGTATSDVHILKNQAVLGEEELGREGSSHDFSFESLDFYAREHLDFAVGFGANRNYYGDITGLSANIREISSK